MTGVYRRQAALRTENGMLGEMKPEDWQETKKVLAAALEKPPRDRAAYLDQACTDPSLRREVESLIVAHGQTDSAFMEAPVVESPNIEALKSGSRLGNYEIIARIGQAAWELSIPPAT